MTAQRDAALRRVESEVGVFLHRVKRAIGERARAVHPDLHPATFLLLAHLVESGPLRAADLVDVFTMDKGGVSRQVQHLVDLGLVERQADPEDRRAQLLAPTDDARERMAAMTKARQARFNERLGDWADDDLMEFAERLARYNEALTDD